MKSIVSPTGMVVVSSLDVGATTIIQKRSVTSATSDLLAFNVTSADRSIHEPEAVDTEQSMV